MNKEINIGIEKNDIKNIVEIFSFFKISDAILFGSRAKGNFSNGSDIDIAVKGNNFG
jgi:predicted nucleotidyltransferase